MGLNNTLYNIATETELSVVLARYDQDFILNLVRENLVTRLQLYQSLNAPNIVAALEQEFKHYESVYGQQPEISQRRAQCYTEIISILCSSHNLKINPSFLEDGDIYSMAFLLYEILVSRFREYLCTFFVNYIRKEKTMIYDIANLCEQKKNKDTSTLYAKKRIDNNKLAIISANLEIVLTEMCAFDIRFEDVLTNIIIDKNQVKFLVDNVYPVQDFYRGVYANYILHEMTRSQIITDIRIAMHSMTE